MMNRKLDKPSGIPKPAVASSSKTVSRDIPKVGAGEKLPLTRDLRNVPAGRRARSPDLGASQSDLQRKKLRRSRSFNDIRDVASSVNPLKRFAPALPPIPAKRVATVTAVRPKPTSTATGVAGARTKAPGKVEAPKPAPVAKRIPPYDYKARFNDLLGKHKELKGKYDAQQEQMGHLKELPELYKESQTQLSECQQELATLKVHYECLEKTSQSQMDQIDDLKRNVQRLEEKLLSTQSQLHKVTQERDQLNMQNAELVEQNKFLSDENATMREDLEACQEQVFASVMERKELHNQMMDLRGNIRVFCRVRPPLESELDRTLCGWNYLDEASLEIVNMDPKAKGQKTEFSFDHIFHPRVPQDEVFANVAPLIQSALDGYNVCIFAYGQTGSGKTYTMDGTVEALGVIPRTVDLVFSAVSKYKRFGWKYEIRATFLEIYNEVLHDLLDPTKTDLEIKMVSANSKTDVYVSNITERVVESPAELRHWMAVAKNNRATACTVGNERSSRSHSISRLQLIGVHEDKQERCVGMINLIDLAGSESPKTSTRMDETKKINRSLSELTNVIMAILNKQDHIPYRNSKLTYLLMPALGGNSKTLMFINVSPLQDCYSESVKSLRFASSVNSVKLTKTRRNRVLNISSS